MVDLCQRTYGPHQLLCLPIPHPQVVKKKKGLTEEIGGPCVNVRKALYPQSVAARGKGKPPDPLGQAMQKVRIRETALTVIPDCVAPRDDDVVFVAEPAEKTVAIVADQLAVREGELPSAPLKGAIHLNA